MSGLTVTTVGAVVTVHFDGSRGNALDHERYAGLRAAAESVTADQVLVLRSAGRHFCTGQDLHQHEAAVAEGRFIEELRHGASAVLAVLRCRGPVVVAAQGACVGAGALLVACADVAVLAEDGWLRLPELELGLPLGAAVAERLLPPPLVRRMMLTGEHVEARMLGSSGAARVVPRSDLDATVTQVVDALCHLDPGRRAVARRLWGDDERERAASAYEREVAASVALLVGHDSAGRRRV
ncbi:hypothetical protein GCM10011608_44870 [Micromonospora sonchi]|uniref:Enoyl-CoA hydratase n=1 Tax=Micromonospora sonchi TaxID=1763543 RepID=A0A917U5G9_9ACTN|nr:enoyl-CoA hydratase/isomerase family protein [Micromonospora sonchi]GGM54973.1 hypothetical protein GCM10011608_44870 [Micromonospora sonchi]